MYTPSFIKRENQYTKGNEYMLTRTPIVEGESNGYVGYYNITAEGPYTERVFTKKSKILFPIRFTNSEQSSTYIKLVEDKGVTTDLEFDDPTITDNLPTPEDYKRGFFIRYFIQQRNDTNGRIKEINKKQFDKLNDASGGINPNFYKGVSFRWKITGPKTDILNNGVVFKTGIQDTNLRTLQEKEFILKGIFQFLRNRVLEFSEYYTDIRETNTDIKL